MKAETIGKLLASDVPRHVAVTLSLSLGPGEEPVERIVKRLVKRKVSPGSIDIVQVHPLARVVSVRGKPGALLPLIQSSEIQDALYSRDADILPKPVNQRAVDITKEKDFVRIRLTSGPTPRRGAFAGGVPKRHK